MAASQAIFFPSPRETYNTYAIQYKNTQISVNNSLVIQILRENWFKRQQNGGADPIKEEVKKSRLEEKENQPEESLGITDCL